MNKRILQYILSVLVLSPLLLFAEINNLNLEVRTAAFVPSSDRFREIYCHVGAEYQFEGSFRYGCWDIWENIGWFSKRGEPVGCHGSTRVSIANLSLGIKYPYTFCNCICAYVGIGPILSRVWIKNNAHCSHEKKSRVSIGAVLKSGVNYFITERLFVDLFIDYSYQPVHLRKWVDVGGLKTGIGIGARL